MMNKTVRNWLIAAAALIFAGALLFAVALAFTGGDITKLGTVDYVTTTFEPSGDFENINMNVYTTDIEFLPSDDGKCKIVCYEDEKVKHSAEVKDGVLTVGTEDSRIWHFFAISFTNPKMTVYLPQNEYGILDIETDTGAVDLPKNFTFDSINIDGHTGAVVCSASANGAVDIDLDTGAIMISDISAGSIKLKADTGSIKLSGADVSDNIGVSAATGAVKIENISCKDLLAEADTGFVSLKDVGCKNLHAETDTGDIKLENVVGIGIFELKSDTGHIGLEGCDATELFIDTDTGSVTGELLTDKIFFAESDTGHVSVPKSTTGGRCEITTDTGSIEMRVRG